MRKSNNTKKFCESSSPGEKEFLPKKLLKDRKAGKYKNPLDFIEKIYGEELGKLPPREFIRQYDMPLYNAYAKWASRHPEDNILAKNPLTTSWDERVGKKIDPYDTELCRKIGSSLSLEERKQFQKTMSKRRTTNYNFDRS